MKEQWSAVVNYVERTAMRLGILDSQRFYKPMVRALMGTARFKCQMDLPLYTLFSRRAFSDTRRRLSERNTQAIQEPSSAWCPLASGGLPYAGTTKINCSRKLALSWNAK